MYFVLTYYIYTDKEEEVLLLLRNHITVYKARFYNKNTKEDLDLVD